MLMVKACHHAAADLILFCNRSLSSLRSLSCSVRVCLLEDPVFMRRRELPSLPFCCAKPCHGACHVLSLLWEEDHAMWRDVVWCRGVMHSFTSSRTPSLCNEAIREITGSAMGTHRMYVPCTKPSNTAAAPPIDPTIAAASTKVQNFRRILRPEELQMCVSLLALHGMGRLAFCWQKPWRKLLAGVCKHDLETQGCNDMAVERVTLP
jgi:hypothetical protein